MRSIKFVQHNDEYDSYYSFADMDDGFGHFNVPGSHWGVRRWQYEDGSLTPAGYEHYGVGKKRKVGVVEKVRNAGIKKIFGEEKLQKQLDYERKHRAKKDVEKVLKRDAKDRPLGSKADIHNFELDRAEKGQKEAIDNLVREMAKEDLSKIVNSDYFKGKGMPRDLSKIIDEKVKDEKYQDYANYLNEKYGPKEKKSLFDILSPKSNDKNDKYPYEGYEDRPKNDKETKEANNVDGYDLSSKNDASNKSENEPKWEQNAKRLGYSSAEEYAKERYRYDFDDESFGKALDGIAEAYADDKYGGDMVNDFLKGFGLTKYDVAYDHDGYIGRKDGKHFVTKDKDGKTHSHEFLDEAFANSYKYGLEPDESAWNENDSSKQQKEERYDIPNKKPSSTNGAKVIVTRESNSSESNKKNWSTDDISKQSDKERMQRIKFIENMHGNGMTFEEIAKRLGISEGSVKNYYYYYN